VSPDRTGARVVVVVLDVEVLDVEVLDVEGLKGDVVLVELLLVLVELLLVLVELLLESAKQIMRVMFVLPSECCVLIG
jgi:hypothetical protein